MYAPECRHREEAKVPEPAHWICGLWRSASWLCPRGHANVHNGARRCETLATPLEANQTTAASFADGDAWARKAILNVGTAGSSSATTRLPNLDAEI